MTLALAMLAFASPALAVESVQVTAANNNVSVQPTAGAFVLQEGSSVRFVAQIRDMAEEKRTTLRFGNQLFLMSPVEEEENARHATIIIPEEGTHELVLETLYQNGTSVSMNVDVISEPGARVTLLDTNTTATDVYARLFVYEDGAWNLFDTTQTQQENPIKLTPTTNYGWYVPEGVYEVRIAKDGYREARSGDIAMTGGYFAPPLSLSRAGVDVLAMLATYTPAASVILLFLATAIELMAQRRRPSRGSVLSRGLLGVGFILSVLLVATRPGLAAAVTALAYVFLFLLLFTQKRK